MSTILQDARFALRGMRRSPGFTAVAVLTLALGIGANSALFSVVRAVFLRPLSYPDPGRLVLLWGATPSIRKEEASPPDFADWKAQSRSFDGMAAARFGSVTLSGDAEPERVLGARVTHDFFETLRVAPALGRSFTPDEDRPGGAKVVMLAHGVWQRRFGGDPAIVGRSIRVNDEPCTVVGVLPASFRLPVSDASVYAPLATDPATTGRRSDSYLVVARLKADTTIDSAQAEMAGIARRLEQQYPNTNTGWTVHVVPMLQDVVEDYRLGLTLLFAAVGCVLLIACANVANLLLARATGRHRELAIRAALGAGRGALVRQLLVESTSLALLGGALGLLVAVWGKAALLKVSPVAIPRMDEARLDAWVLGFTFLVSLLTGIVFGLAPALHAIRTSQRRALQEGGRGIAGDTRGRLRGLLVVSQLCLALVLLVGTALSIRSFALIQQVSPGFDAGAALTARVSLPAARYKEDPSIADFFSRLKQRLAAQPGVAAVTFANVLPVDGGGPYLSFTVEGEPAPAPGSTPDANVRTVDPDYFAVMGVPLRAGRLPGPADRETTAQVLVVNETLARLLGHGASPIGKRIAFGTDGAGKPSWREVVGVVGDVRHEGLDQDEVRAAYAPIAQTAPRSVSIVLRTEGKPESLTAGLRAALGEVDPGLALYSIRTYDEILRASLRTRRFAMILLAFFGCVGVALAGLGIYSVLSYAVTQRRHEIGVRMALGAGRNDVVRMVVRQGMTLAAVGLGLGAILSLGALSFASSLLYQVSPFDPLSLAAAISLLGAISLAACLVPAARASGVDPAIALRQD